MEQITLFDMFEKNERLQYQKQLLDTWSKTPLETFIKENDERRKTIVNEVYAHYCELYNKLLHKCKNMPDDIYIWCNVYHYVDGEYWVMNKKGEISGANIDKCPFCSADLKHQKGDVIAYRTETDKRIKETINRLERE